jgi:succinoglycan biosynthesis protein ExoW
MSRHIAVVIPYFQHAPGVLARTLAAVFAQDIQDRLDVIIVDDASPVSAANELANLNDAARASIRIIERKNGGPAAARNSGLAALPAGAEYVALLDSDDVWQRQHLARALAALDLGYDFYFSNHRRERAKESHFSQCGIRPEDHRAINPMHDIYCWEGDLFDASLRQIVVGLSTVVYRRAALPEIHFNEAVETADDMYFALQVARDIRRVAFSPNEDVLYMDADNLSATDDWRSNKSLRVGLSFSLFYGRVMNDFDVTREQRIFLRQGLRAARRAFASAVMAMLRAGKRVDARYVLRFLLHDPAVLTAFPTILVTEIGKRALGK